MKKRLPFILVILIILISIGVFIIYNVYFKETDVKNNAPSINNNLTIDELDTSITENDEIKISESQEEKELIKDDDVSIINEDTSQKNETTTSNNDVNSSSSKHDSPSNNNTSDNKQEEIPIPEEKQEEIIISSDKQNMEETSEISEIDKEYARLKSLIKYETDQECFEASIDESFKYEDDENFKVISCESYAYAGRLVGYRMMVYYWDGTVKYLDAID